MFAKVPRSSYCNLSEKTQPGLSSALLRPDLRDSADDDENSIQSSKSVAQQRIDVLNQIQPHNEPSPENHKGALKGNSIINADPSYHLKLHH